ncbi:MULTISPECIES: hypothetical protein [unclassified Streptomyces]|uniref:Class F sortase n=1 Tax=Streptomyces sp. NBC_00060 TaxID=2975636 RepID=A0AAU2HC47_9ACTN
MARRRLQVDGDVVAAVGWWGAILTGLVLVGLSADQELRHDASGGRAAVTAPDVTVAPESGGDGT